MWIINLGIEDVKWLQEKLENKVSGPYGLMSIDRAFYFSFLITIKASASTIDGGRSYIYEDWLEVLAAAAGLHVLTLSDIHVVLNLNLARDINSESKNRYI